jgi:type I restriction enzyme R subunit
MVNQNPEQIARDRIDERLIQAGWVVQNAKQISWTKGLGIAVREYQTEVGPVDYALFVDMKPVGVIEAKKDSEGERLTVVETQSSDYANSKLKHINNEPLPFRYESTGVLTRFTDIRDPKPRSRRVFSFHTPQTLQEWSKQDKSLRARLLNLPVLGAASLRDCQFNAINNLESSFKQNKPKALIQMATGAGKTFTAITFVYRLLKYANAKRILFLVDTKNLGEQAEQEFMAFKPVDDNRKFTELYNVTRLKSKHIPSDSQVYISTIQRLYSVLRNEELDESLEEENPNELKLKPPSEVGYNSKIPPEFFDFVIVDECHRSIYNLWKQVLDYSDSFLIGLTATPDKRTFGFFDENVVSEYPHTKAVADGVNVGYDVYTIETEITKQGSKIQAKEYVDKRERMSRKTRWEQVDEEVAYSSKDLDREVVNASQIRKVIKTFKEKLPEIFPGREEIPKTLIFAKTDSHADDIINVVREEFGEGNDFCKKITYQAKEDPKSVLADFRNAYNPRIAVTVDMIATGTDVKPLECLLFMRDVKSKNYYEQMLGRGTRTLNYEDLKRVTPSARSAKTHFVVVDAIGVCKSQKTDARPLEKKKTVPMKDLLAQVLMGSDEEAVYSSLASRLARLDKELDKKDKDQFKKLANGLTLPQVINQLLTAHDPDEIESLARKKFKVSEQQPLTEDQTNSAKADLIKVVRSSFNGELNSFIEKSRQAVEQIIDRTNLDKLLYAGPASNQREKLQEMATEFKNYIEANKNEITALKILFNEPHNRKLITYQMVRDLFDHLKRNKPNLAPMRVYEAYAELDGIKNGTPKTELTAIVALVRRVCGLDSKITEYSHKVDKNFQDWIFRRHSGNQTKFNKEQIEWLHMIKDHISTSFHLDRDDLDLSPFDKKGGLAGMYNLFGDVMDSIILEMNESLVA